MAKNHKMNFKVMAGVLAIMIIIAIAMSLFFDANNSAGRRAGADQQIAANNQPSSDVQKDTNELQQTPEANSNQETAPNEPQEQPAKQNEEPAPSPRLEAAIVHDVQGNEIVISSEDVELFTEATRDNDVAKCNPIQNEAHKAMCKFAITGEKNCAAIISVAEFREICQ